MITIFQNIKSIDVPHHRTIDFVLTRIKEGNSKDLLFNIRKESDKNARNELKKGLPSILFSGQFPNRKTGAKPIEHSGFIILDIDNIKPEDIAYEKETICKSEFVHACFLSPSANGFKVLVKIPADIKRHTDYFNGLEKYFSEALDIELDTSGKNIGRVCYESFDPDIYINEKSAVFVDLIEPIVKEKYIDIPTIPVTDLSEIEKRVITWWNKNYTYQEGAKHSSTIALIGAFNRFGVSEMSALSYCNSLSTNSQSHKANETRVRDIYFRYGSAFGSEKFEDVAKTKDVTNRITGKDIDIAVEVLKEYSEFQEFTPVELEKVAETMQSNAKVKKPNNGRVFWYYDDGKLKIDIQDMFTFINDCGYWIYYPVKAPDNYQYIKIENNIIRHVDTRDIKNTVLNFVNNNDQNAVYNVLNERTKYWNEKFLNVLPSIDPSILRDSKYISYFPTKSGVYKVTKDSIDKIDYVDLVEGYVWDTQITSKDFNYTNPDGDFKKLTYNISGGAQNFDSLRTVIGYLLHNYKDPANSKAVFLFDKNITQLDGEPEGGSGKSLLFEGIKWLREVACVTGDRIDFKKSFVFQEVSESTQITWIDEPDKDLDMKNFFTRITNGLPIEKKNKNVIYIPNEKAPKFGFTTNFKPKGSSGSHKRRRIDFGVSAHYNINHTPIDEFSKNFFTEWDDSEWNQFFTFYLDCVKYFLLNGVIKQEDEGSEFLEYATEFGVEFTEYLINDGALTRWMNKGSLNTFDEYKYFVSNYEHDEILIKKFLFRVRKVLSLKNIKFKESGKGERRAITFSI